MIVRKIVLAASVAALMSSPAWALPSHAPSNAGTAHAPSNGDHGNPNAGDRSSGQHHGKSHKCKPHKVAYVAAGLLVSQTLTKDDGSQPPPTTTTTTSALHQNADDTYSGDVTIDVKRTNHHAAGDKGQTVTYTVSHAHVTFGLQDVNNDGGVDLDDLQPNARVKVIGKITTIARRCDHTGFTPEITIRRIVFHAPADASPNP